MYLAQLIVLAVSFGCLKKLSASNLEQDQVANQLTEVQVPLNPQQPPANNADPGRGQQTGLPGGPDQAQRRQVNPPRSSARQPQNKSNVVYDNRPPANVRQQWLVEGPSDAVDSARIHIQDNYGLGVRVNAPRARIEEGDIERSGQTCAPYSSSRCPRNVPHQMDVRLPRTERIQVPGQRSERYPEEFPPSNETLLPRMPAPRTQYQQPSAEPQRASAQRAQPITSRRPLPQADLTLQPPVRPPRTQSYYQPEQFDYDHDDYRYDDDDDFQTDPSSFISASDVADPLRRPESFRSESHPSSRRRRDYLDDDYY